MEKEEATMKYFIVTGASRGLGAATVKKVAQKGNRIVCIARTQNEEIVKEAQKNGAIVSFVEADLTDHSNVETLLEGVLAELTPDKVEEIYLIQNAGMVDPIKTAGNAPSDVVTNAVHLNLLTPMLMTNKFIELTSTLSCKKVIVHVSSGAGTRPIYGWNTYCTTKAGLNMYTNAVGLEQQLTSNPVTVIAFSPGIMDTEMQAVIRSSNEEDFADINTFKEYHEKGALRSPEFVAEKMVELIYNQKLENGRVYDIKELI